MRTLFLTFLISLLFPVVNAFASDVLVLQSMRVKPFDEALRGFRNVCKTQSKTVVVTDAEGYYFVRTVREERPSLILAIGAEALQKVKKIRDIPIIYLMALNPENIIGEAKNFVGVNMTIPPERYLRLMEKLNLPELKVGVFYDPAKSGTFVRRVQQAAKSMDIEITAREVHHSKEVPELLTRMKGSCNILWMLPDSTVVTPETVEYMLLFTLQNRMPVVAFAGKYVDTGALFSLDIDGYDMGKQAGEMANKILDGADISVLPNAEARKAVMRINRKVAQKLGINIKGIENN